MPPVSGAASEAVVQKLRPDQQDEIVAMISKGTKTGAEAARLFNVHPATVSRILARAGAGTIRVEV
jgi:transposase-like protein